MKQKFILKNIYAEHEILREYQQHERKMLNVSSSINFQSSSKQGENSLDDIKNIHQKSYKYQLLQKQSSMNTYNQKILNKLVDIASGNNGVYNQKNQKTFSNKFSGSLNENKNKKEIKRINTDNEKLAKKLINCQSNLRIDSLQKSFSQNRTYRNIAQKFRTKLPPLPVYQSRTSRNMNDYVPFSSNFQDNQDSLEETQIVPAIKKQEEQVEDDQIQQRDDFDDQEDIKSNSRKNSNLSNIQKKSQQASNHMKQSNQPSIHDQKKASQKISVHDEKQSSKKVSEKLDQSEQQEQIQINNDVKVESNQAQVTAQDAENQNQELEIKDQE